MHYAHVKRKEQTMNRYIIEEFYNDPALRRRLFEEAHRERSRSIKAGWAWLRKELRQRFDFRPGHWMERLG
jgi:hypothetical protein